MSVVFAAALREDRYTRACAGVTIDLGTATDQPGDAAPAFPMVRAVQ